MGFKIPTGSGNVRELSGPLKRTESSPCGGVCSKKGSFSPR